MKTSYTFISDSYAILLVINIEMRDFMNTLYEIEVKDYQGEIVSLSKYQNSVLLIVNTAVKCGLAPQYEGLQALYESYKDEGLVVLDFPSNQFLQSPETNDDTNTICQTNYGTTFPRFDKVNVNGDNASPLFKFLRQEQGGILGSVIKWNFTKFLVDRQGQVVKRYAPTVQPKDIEADIKTLL